MDKVNDAALAQRVLIETIDAASHWRQLKADEHPNDGRNSAASRVLDSLARYVASWPETDPRLRQWTELMIDGVDVMPLSEMASLMLGRFRFHPPKVVSRDEFLRELLEMSLKEKRETDSDGLPKGLRLVPLPAADEGEDREDD